MARELVSVRTNGYQMKEGDLLYPLVPCTLKSGQGFANGGQSKSSPFQNCKGNLVTDLTRDSVEFPLFLLTEVHTVFGTHYQ